MNSQYRKNLPGTQLDYFDAREAVDDLRTVDGDAREDVRDELEEVVDLGLGAHDGLAHVVLEVPARDAIRGLRRLRRVQAGT